MSDLVGLLCSFSSSKNEIQLSFCERSSQSSTATSQYVFHLPSSEDSVVVEPIPWLNGLSPSDMFSSNSVDMMRKAADKIHYAVSPRDVRGYLSLIAMISSTDWTVTACSGAGEKGNRMFFFEKEVDALPPPPPPPNGSSTPPLPEPKTPKSQRSNGLDLSMELTEEEETVSFKQKLAFGIKIKKIPNNAKLGMQTFHTITLRTKVRNLQLLNSSHCCRLFEEEKYIILLSSKNRTQPANIFSSYRGVGVC